jgi:hypothetical protein
VCRRLRDAVNLLNCPVGWALARHFGACGMRFRCVLIFNSLRLHVEPHFDTVSMSVLLGVVLSFTSVLQSEIREPDKCGVKIFTAFLIEL